LKRERFAFAALARLRAPERRAVSSTEELK